MKFRNLGMLYNDVDETGAGAGSEQGATDQQAGTTEEEQGAEDQQQEKTYTQAELDDLLKKAEQRAGDQARTKAAKERREAEIAKMNEQEAERARFEDEKAQLLIDKEEHNKSVMLNKATDILTEREMDISLKNIVVGATEEETIKNIDNAEKVINSAVQKQLDSKLKALGHNPRQGEVITGQVTQEKINKMTANERSANRDEIIAFYGGGQKGEMAFKSLKYKK